MSLNEVVTEHGAGGSPSSRATFDPARGDVPPAFWPCKVCGSTAALAFTRSVEDGHLVEACVLPKGYARPYYRCPECNLLFHVGFDVLAEEHRHVYELEGVGDALDKQVNRGMRELVMVDAFLRLHGMSPKEPVLVFGCGSGLSYNYMLGVGLNAYATDLSVQFATAAEVFKENNFRKELLPQMLRRFRKLDDIADGSMSLITMTEVFEHFLDPVPLMCRLARLLRPGGLLIGTTGWVDKVEGNMKEWWYLKCLSHATFLSAKSFQRICTEAGCLGTLYPNTATLKGNTGMSPTQCIFAMQKPL